MRWQVDIRRVLRDTVNTMLTESELDQAPSLSPEQRRRVENALAQVLRKGWGQVSIVVVKGRVVAFKTEIHTSLD